MPNMGDACMTQSEIAPDGNLPAARRRLGNAISALIDPKPNGQEAQQ